MKEMEEKYKKYLEKAKQVSVVIELTHLVSLSSIILIYLM